MSLGLRRSRRYVGVVMAGLLSALSTACLGGDEGDGEIDRISLSLTGPEADVSEVRSLGLFALDIDQDVFQCADYLDGEVDPISQTPNVVVAVDFVDVSTGLSELNISFEGIPVGDRVIIVEAYDAGGSRLFMGCSAIRIAESRTSRVDVAMQPDEGL